MNKKGQRVIAGLLFFFMAIVSVALLMEPLRDAIPLSTDALSGYEHETLTVLLITYWPVFFVIMALIILIIILRDR